MSIVRVQSKGQVTIPTRLRNQAGISEGDLIEARLERGRIVLTPKAVIDRSQFATADDDYTPAQRRIIDARLAKGEEDIKRGRRYGPFETADELIASMKKELKKRAAAKNVRRSQ